MTFLKKYIFSMESAFALMVVFSASLGAATFIEHEYGTDAARAVDRGGLGTTLVVDRQNKLCGIITDGDIRRMVVSGRPTAELTVEDVMTKNPRTQTEDAPTFDALNIMELNQITVLPIVSSDGEVKGILHLHDILGKGEFKFNGY